MQYLTFSIDQQNFGFDLGCIEHVILAVEITPLPHSPKHVMGMINIHGQVIPVINLRKLLGLEEREIELKDQILICNLEGKTIALWIDAVSGIKAYSHEALIPAGEIFPDLKEVDYVVKENDLIILIYDLKKLLPEAIHHGTYLAT